jgi:hypothetical protein
MIIKQREKTAIFQSLAAGVVPKIGLHHIQVGRKLELEALISDLMNIEDCGATVRFVIGRFGSGKSFFLNLIRTVALERNFVVLQADITVDRRLYGTGGFAKALYTELVKNMSTRAKPEGGAMLGLVEKFVIDVHSELNGEKNFEILEAGVKKRLENLLELTHGINFVRVLARYVEGFSKNNEDLMNSAVRWLRAEYGTKTEARQDLGVRDIIEDSHLYDMLKLWSGFIRIAGYKGLLVNMDEMVVLSERLNNTTAREKNYEIILQILNDCLQGYVEGLGFCFAGTEEFLSDKRRGLFSYEALATRLADNPFTSAEIIDTKGPVIRLQPLSREDLFVLLERITIVQAGGNSDNRLMDNDGLVKYMNFCEQRLGSKYFLTPRDAVQQFVGLLNVLEQNPGKTMDDFLKSPDQPAINVDTTLKENKNKPDEDDLIRFKL